MKIIMSKDQFVDRLAKVQGIVERRNTLPILSYVLVEADDSRVKLVSTDLEVSLTATYSPVEIEQPGTVTIMAKKAFEIARELPDKEVTITSEEHNWVRITSGSATFRMVGLPKEDFPDMPSYNEEASVYINRAALVDMIERTAFAISHDQQRYALNGVLLETTTATGEGGKQICRMVATDGHRLAMVERPCLRGATVDQRVILPRKAVLELRKIIGDLTSEEIRVDIQDKQFFVVGDEVVMAARLIEGQFPEYHQVIPKESKRTAVINREGFTRALRRISILSADRSSPVKFALESGSMTISTNNPDVGEASESMPVVFDGDSIELGFNARYVLDVLAVGEAETVELHLNEPLLPGLLTMSQDPGYKYVIMPMRL